MCNAVLAAVLLISPLAACGSEGSDEPTGPAVSETVTEATVVPDTPSELGTETTPGLAGAPADNSSCGADKLDRWLNVLPTEDVKAEIAATVGELRIRYYTQGDPITMDYSEARLNVELGDDGRIKLFRCG